VIGKEHQKIHFLFWYSNRRYREVPFSILLWVPFILAPIGTFFLILLVIPLMSQLSIPASYVSFILTIVKFLLFFYSRIEIGLQKKSDARFPFQLLLCQIIEICGRAAGRLGAGR